MREIKFRAWEKELKRMFTFEELDDATGGLVKVGNKALKEEYGEDMKLMPGGLFIPTKDENIVIMQYTGLKDKNGKEIYEGDIVLYQVWTMCYEGGGNDSFINKGIIEYINDNCCFNVTERQTVDITDVLYQENDDLEVIGNIYDNPDLIKE